MNSKTDSSWKQALLKTSLPLEFLVAERLAAREYESADEFSYMRTNEHGVETEFSVDIWASRLLADASEDFWASLDLFIECKYAHPGVRWIFAPRPFADTPRERVLFDLQELCTSRFARPSLHAFAARAPYCMKGIELHEKDANPQAITRGLNQLRYGVAALVEGVYSEQLRAQSDVTLLPHIICSMLVTTASLYVLTENSELETYRSAETIEEVATPVDSVVVHQRAGSNLRRHLHNVLKDTFADAGGMSSYVAEIKRHMKSAQLGRFGYPSEERIQDQARWATEQVLVVTLDALDRTLDEIDRVVDEVAMSVVRFASMKRDEFGGAFFEARALGH
jgi:hypothetical protein